MKFTVFVLIYSLLGAFAQSWFSSLFGLSGLFS